MNQRSQLFSGTHDDLVVARMADSTQWRTPGSSKQLSGLTAPEPGC